MYSYKLATSRNIGWVTEQEQQGLANKKVAIGGLGGVGGAHLITLARLGITQFSIADLDGFEVHNFNRQTGAFVSTLGQPKLDVTAKMALDINPEMTIDRFEEGINAENIDAFLEGVDLYVDSLDIFALDARKLVFKRCAELKIPAITAAPLGMGCSFLAFLPGKMTFEEYFKLEGCSREDQLVRLVIGLSPVMFQVKYLVDPSAADFEAQKAPSTPMGIELCAGIAATNALKILLNRGSVPCAPRGVHFDAYRSKFKISWRPGGNSNPLQKLAFKVAKKILFKGK